ncbi:MAG: ParB/RepB/Spo0J family partition protein [Janthinobacterium lividum]
MATKEKKAKASAVKPAGFVDAGGHLLAVGDSVRYQHPTSLHSGGTGTLTAIHPRQDEDTPPIATVQLDKLGTWKEAPAIPALAENLTWLATPLRDSQGAALAIGDLVRVLPDVSKRLSNQLATFLGEAGTNITGAALCRIRLESDPEKEDVILTSFLVKAELVEALPEPPPIEEESDLPFLNEQAQAEMRNIALADIIVTSNTRKIFDETELQGLADSIKAQGVIAPITVRPHATEAGKYELVAGERRLRASKLAEQVTIPAVIRTLTDREFLEVQLLENLQRVDVRPADEAQAFSKLLKNDFSAEEVALKVGKPVKFVLQRAKLASLIPNWFEKLENDTLDLAAAHELARLPVHSQLVVWRKADKEISANVWNAPKALTDTFKKSYVRELIAEEVLRDLSTAIWPLDDATLDLSAGACTQCPKRSSCQGLLFAAKDPEKDRCLDGPCFAGKRTKYLARRVREVTAELGTEPLQVSSFYSPEKKEGTESVLGTRDFHWSRVDMPGAVPAVQMDGIEVGQLRYVLLREVFTSTGSTTTKEERAASLRNTRTKRITNELLAGDLRDLFAQSLPTGGAAANALLDHFLDHALTWGYSRIPSDTLDYLVAAHGWAAPTEQDLNGSYISADKPSGHRQYIRRQLDAIPSVLAKVVLYFDLKKFRNGLEQKEPTHAQRTLLAALPKEMQKSLSLDERAAAAVEERFYTKKGKKQEATA